MSKSQRVISIVFYAGLGAVLAAILTTLLPELLPEALASKVSYNSEGYVLAVLLGLWIQFARPRLSGTSREWPVTALAAAACLAVGIFLFNSDLPSRFKTLNETFIALSLIIVYVQARRRQPQWVAITLSLVVLAIIVLFSTTDLVTNLAESLGMLLLVPLAFDVVDRGILSPEAVTSPRLRYGWYAALIVVPTTFSLLWHFGSLTGLAYDITRYDIRMHEAFVGILLVELYFAVGLGRTGQTDRAGREHPNTVAA